MYFVSIGTILSEMAEFIAFKAFDPGQVICLGLSTLVVFLLVLFGAFGPLF